MPYRMEIQTEYRTIASDDVKTGAEIPAVLRKLANELARTAMPAWDAKTITIRWTEEGQ